MEVHVAAKFVTTDPPFPPGANATDTTESLAITVPIVGAPGIVGSTTDAVGFDGALVPTPLAATTRHTYEEPLVRFATTIGDAAPELLPDIPPFEEVHVVNVNNGARFVTYAIHGRRGSGEIVVNGTDINKLSRGQLADWRAANIGYIFQMHNLIPVLSAYENIELPLLLLPMSAAVRQKRVEIALEAVNLRDRANHYPRQLSGGQEQRVGIARAIVANPTIIVGDEPTGDLDADTTEQILDLVQRLNSELGMTLLLVTHDPRVAALAPRQLRLEKGKLIEKGREVSLVVPELSERSA